ncbi:serine protease 1-like isoform X2 [Gordionus sp. m RMFG-2023]|uniref:serine protease 1-like isoform X2 n=1 Tax=Gordionus sp. m RMFG-2023 TaxID=3053472 RepID=UPI0031FD413D
MFYPLQNSEISLCLTWLHGATSNNARDNSFKTTTSKMFYPKFKPIEENIISFPTVVGGIRTKIKEYPFLVSIRVNDKYDCAGIIIDSDKILTVAHCMKPGIRHSLYTIHCGKSKIYGNEPGQKVFSIKAAIIHENYVREDNQKNKFQYDNDIAIIKLNETLKFTANIMKAELPKANEKITPNTYCCVAGWGKTKGHGDVNVLNEICIPTWSTLKCNRKEFYDGKISNNMICAGEESGGIDSCHGDSGGPLLCYKRATSSKKVSGLVSWGKGCAESNKPGVYLDLSKYIDWIKTNSKKLQFEP